VHVLVGCRPTSECCGLDVKMMTGCLPFVFKAANEFEMNLENEREREKK